MERLIILILFVLYSSHIFSQVMVLDALYPPGNVHFNLDYNSSACASNSAPDGWMLYVASPDCASARGGVMFPPDDDDEVLMFGEAIKRDISSLGLIAGTTITISIVAAVGNLNQGEIPVPDGDHSFNVKIFSAEPIWPSTWGIGAGMLCTATYDNLYGGQLVLSGDNDGLLGMTFTNTVTLNQDANWIAIGNCGLFTGDPIDLPTGSVLDDLTISW